jgi:hypothetical protein
MFGQRRATNGSPVIVIALAQWGDGHMANGRSETANCKQAYCGNFLQPSTVCSECGKSVVAASERAMEDRRYVSVIAPLKGVYPARTSNTEGKTAPQIRRQHRRYAAT